MFKLEGNAMDKWDDGQDDTGIHYSIDRDKKVIRRKHVFYVKGVMHYFYDPDISCDFIGSDTPEWVIKTLSELRGVIKQYVDIKTCKHCHAVTNDYNQYHKDAWCVAGLKKPKFISVDIAEGKDKTSFYFADEHEFLKQNKEREMCNGVNFRDYLEVSTLRESEQEQRLRETETRSKLAITRLDAQEDINGSLRNTIARVAKHIREELESEIEELKKRIEALENKPTFNFKLPEAKMASHGSGYMNIQLPDIRFHTFGSFGLGELFFKNVTGSVVRDYEGNFVGSMLPGKPFEILRKMPGLLGEPFSEWIIEERS